MQNNWSSEIEDIIADYALESQIFFYIYNQCVSTYHRRINYYMIPSIIISSITGALLFDKRIAEQLIISYILASCNIFVAILSTLLKFFNYQDLETQSKILSIKYLELYEDMKFELSKHPNNRIDANEYLNMITKKRQELYNNYSVIQDEIRKKFKSRHRDLQLPVKLSHISKIKIYGREIESIDSKTPSDNTIMSFIV